MNMLGLFVTVAGLTAGEPNLPTDTAAPIQILAQLDDKGQLTLVIPYTVFVRQDAPKGSGATFEIVPETREETRTVPLKDIRVYRAGGAEADRGKLPAELRKPTPALLWLAGDKLDRRHLRLYRNSTLVFVGPMPKVAGPFKVGPDK